MKKLFLGIFVLGLLLSGNANAQVIRLTCEGINTQNLVITVREKHVVVDDGKMEGLKKPKLKINHIGKNEIKASISKYEGFFTKNLVMNTTLTLNTISGIGKFEIYSDYKGGVPNKYAFLSYKNCRFF